MYVAKKFKNKTLEEKFEAVKLKLLLEKSENFGKEYKKSEKWTIEAVVNSFLSDYFCEECETLSEEENEKIIEKFYNSVFVPKENILANVPMIGTRIKLKGKADSLYIKDNKLVLASFITHRTAPLSKRTYFLYLIRLILQAKLVKDRFSAYFFETDDIELWNVRNGAKFLTPVKITDEKIIKAEIICKKLLELYYNLLNFCTPADDLPGGD